MSRAAPVLASHPVNQARVAAGKPPANAIWLWGQGKAPSVPKFSELHQLEGCDHLGGRPGARRGRVGRLDADRRARRDRLPRHRLRRQGRAMPSRHSKSTTSSACTSRLPTRPATRGGTTAKVEALERIDRDIVGPIRSALWRLTIGGGS